MASKQEEAITITALVAKLKATKEYSALQFYYNAQRERLITSVKMSKAGTAEQAKAIGILEGFDIRDKYEDFIVNAVRQFVPQENPE